jgi:hypothetical protein
MIKGRHPLSRSVCILALGFAAVLCQGCATSQNSLTLASMDQKKDFSQSFDKAYASINDNGDYDLILVHDSNFSNIEDADGTVQPQAMNPRQLVHIRVYWNAHSGVKPDHPASTNSSIRWYIVDDGPNESADLLEYSGCGLVMLNANGQTATFNVRGAFLRPVTCRGCMTDPIGPGTITGTVTAVMDADHVKELLAEVNAMEASSAPQANAGAIEPNSTATR